MLTSLARTIEKTKKYGLANYLIHDISMKKVVEDLGERNPYVDWDNATVWGNIGEINATINRQLISFEEKLENSIFNLNKEFRAIQSRDAKTL